MKRKPMDPAEVIARSIPRKGLRFNAWIKRNRIRIAQNTSD